MSNKETPFKICLYKRYMVMEGVFKGHIFTGYPININGEDRLWDDTSIGHSFPSDNCMEIPNE